MKHWSILISGFQKVGSKWLQCTNDVVITNTRMQRLNISYHTACAPMRHFNVTEHYHKNKPQKSNNICSKLLVFFVCFVSCLYVSLEKKFNLNLKFSSEFQVNLNFFTSDKIVFTCIFIYSWRVIDDRAIFSNKTTL